MERALPVLLLFVIVLLSLQVLEHFEMYASSQYVYIAMWFEIGLHRFEISDTRRLSGNSALFLLYTCYL